MTLKPVMVFIKHEDGWLHGIGKAKGYRLRILGELTPQPKQGRKGKGASVGAASGTSQRDVIVRQVT